MEFPLDPVDRYGCGAGAASWRRRWDEQLEQLVDEQLEPVAGRAAGAAGGRTSSWSSWWRDEQLEPVAGRAAGAGGRRRARLGPPRRRLRQDLLPRHVQQLVKAHQGTMNNEVKPEAVSLHFS